MTPRKIINGSLFVLATPDQRDQLNPTDTKLEPGKVQLRLFIDKDNALAKSPTLLLNSRAPDTTFTLDAKFGIGFKNADIVE
ncbi:MAG: hypothetical protein ACR2OA_09670 [Rubripirellula sp.]